MINNVVSSQVIEKKLILLMWANVLEDFQSLKSTENLAELWKRVKKERFLNGSRALRGLPVCSVSMSIWGEI